MIDLLNHPALANLDPRKADLLRTAFAQTSKRSRRSLATVLMSLITNANKQGIHFTPDETAIILELMKDGKSPAEQGQIDQMSQLVSSMLRQHSIKK